MDGIQVEYSYPATPDVLWRALTERAKIAGWWGENDFVPETGHQFTVSAIGLAALAGPIQCTVLELEPERRLVMSWRVGTTRATVSLLIEASSAGSVLVVTRRGSVGPAAPVDVEQAMATLFDGRLRAAVTRAPAEISAGASGSVSLWGNGPAPLKPLDGPLEPPAYGLGTPRGRAAVAEDGKRSRGWPAIAIVAVVAIVAIVFLLGALGRGPDGSGSGTLGQGPNATGPGGDPAFPAAGPALPGGGQPNQPGQAAQPNQSGQPGQPGPAGGGPGPTGGQTTTNPPPGGTAHLSVTFVQINVTLTSYEVVVTVTNTGNASGHWAVVGAGLTGVNLSISVLGATVTDVVRQGTHCFSPTGSLGTVPAGQSATFRFTVSALLQSLLGTITGVALDSAPCV